MDYCKKCQNFGCNAAGTERTTTDCEEYMSHLPTNADRIRAMSDEELARFFYDEYGCPLGRGYPDCGETPTDPVCMGCWFDWLNQEADS